jgi:integrase
MDNRHIGFKLRPDSVNAFTQRLAADVECLMADKQASLFEQHNIFTLYTLSLLMWATGHRPVQDPFCYRSDIDTENGWALVCDKVADERRAWRLVCLCRMAVQQLHQYNKHLESLKIRLAKGGAKELALAASLLAIQSDSTDTRPYLFLITEKGFTKSIFPKDLERFWELYLPLRGNFGRHEFASQLMLEDVALPAINAAMGHNLTPDHHLGVTSEISVIRLMDQLRAPIEQMMTGFGWRALNGLRFNKTVPLPKSISRLALPQHYPAILGPDNRARKREDRKLQAEDLVHECVNEELGIPVDGKLTRHAAEALFDRIKALTEERKLGNLPIRQAFLAWVENYTQSGGVVEQLRMAIDIKSEPSPLTRYSLREYKQFQAARDRWINWIKTASDNDSLPDAPSRIAALVVDAALVSNLANEQQLHSIPYSVMNYAYNLGGDVHVELYQKQSIGIDQWLGRWHPSKTSCALLIGLYKEPGGWNVALVRKSLVQICKEIGITGNSKNIISKLRSYAEAAILFERPGYCHIALTHDRLGVAALPDAYFRMKTGLVGERPEPERTLQDREQSETWLPDLGATTEYKSRRIINDELRALINSSRLVADSGEFTNQRALNRGLGKALKTWASSSELPIAARLCAAWGRKLCLTGTLQKSEPAIATIDKYLGLVMNGLLKEVPNEDIVGYSPEEYEELYLRIVDRGTQKDQAQLVAQLANFHHYLVDTFSAEQCYFGGVFGVAERRLAQVSAAIITEEEYFRAVKYILNDPSISNERTRNQYLFMLMVGFRFGLRFGEIHRLQRRDIQYLDDFSLIYILVRESVYGKVKSDAGVRQIPLLEDISDEERSVFDVVMSEGILAEGDHQLGVMTEVADERPLLDRVRLSGYLNQVLKLVTGSKKAHFHHLRHGFASRVHAAIVSSSITCSAWEWESRNVHVYRLHEECRVPNLLRSLSQIMGHASVETSAQYYIHSWPAIFSGGAIEHTLKNQAYLTRANYEAARQRQSRFKRSKSVGQFNLIDDRLADDKTLRVDLEYFREFAPPDWSAIPSQTERIINPALIEQILYQVAVRRGQFSGLAAALYISENALLKLIQIAEGVERESGFDRYGLFRATDDSYYALLGPRDARINAPPLIEHKRLQRFLRGFETCCESWDSELELEFRNAISGALRMMSGNQGRLICLSETDENLVESLVSLFGIDPNNVVYKIKANLTYTDVLSQRLKLKDKPYTILENAPRSREKSALRRELSRAVDFSNYSSDIGGHRSFAKLILIFAIYHRVVR